MVSLPHPGRPSALPTSLCYDSCRVGIPLQAGLDSLHSVVDDGANKIWRGQKVEWRWVNLNIQI